MAVTKEQQQEVGRLLVSGVAIPEISKQLDINTAAIYNIRKKLEVAKILPPLRSKKVIRSKKRTPNFALNKGLIISIEVLDDGTEKFSRRAVGLSNIEQLGLLSFASTSVMSDINATPQPV